MPEADSPETAKRIFATAWDWMLKRTIALYLRRPDGNPVMHGSGVLLQIADATFVLSASHVLDTEPEDEILVGPMEDDSRLLSLATKIGRSPDKGTIDVGFASLPEPVTRELARHGKQFLRLTELELGNEPSHGFYSVAGYPQKKNTPDNVSKVIGIGPFCYGTYLYPETVGDFTPGVSIVLACTKETVNGLDGQSERMPHLKGISGCGIWRLYGTGDRLGHLDRWDTTWIRLSGIEHCVVEKKYIKGTLIRHVIKLIAAVYPDLHASMRLTLPG